MTFIGRLVFLLIIAGGAIGLGAVSAERVTRTFPGFVPIHVENWRGYPGLATRAADPYARANLARTGKLAIADTEGIEFTARLDADGNALRTACNYYVVGNVPANRLWTFRAETMPARGEPMRRQPNFTSSRLHARTANTDVSLNVGPRAAGLNWLPLEDDGNQPVMFIMTFYDSAIATTASFTDLEMPTIRPVGCADG